MPCPKRLWPEAAESDTFAFERALRKQGYSLVAGTDEVGRGPLAGPVMAACVLLPRGCDYKRFKDSKKLSPGVRRQLVEELERMGALVGIGSVSAADIDRLNILRASLLAMKMAVENLPVDPDFLLVDGKFPVPLPLPQQALVKGDSRSASIAAASIVAKVKRDAVMARYHQQYPLYNFQQHKGYATQEHRRLIELHGPCKIHRLSFRPVRKSLGRET